VSRIISKSKGNHLELSQQEFIEQGLKQHGTILKEHGFLPPQTNEPELDYQETAEDPLLKNCCRNPSMKKPKQCIITLEYHLVESENETETETESEPEESHDSVSEKRHVPQDVIQLQMDEVVTKSQESGRKTNKTFTATIEDCSGRMEYLAAKTQPE
jgi:hypothetical protein